MNLVHEAINYAGQGEYDAETDAAIRKVRVITTVLLTAVNAAATVPSPPRAVPPA
jgi:hypothetical protein